MPDESPLLNVGSQVWAWVDPGRWHTATVVEVRELNVTVRLSKMHNTELVDVGRELLRPRDFGRQGADRPRRKPA